MKIQDFIKMRDEMHKKMQKSVAGSLIAAYETDDDPIKELAEEISIWICETFLSKIDNSVKKQYITPCNRGVEYCFFCGEPDPEKLSVREIGISHPGSMCGDDYSFCFDCIASISAGEFLEKITSSV